MAVDLDASETLFTNFVLRRFFELECLTLLFSTILLIVKLIFLLFLLASLLHLRLVLCNLLRKNSRALAYSGSCSLTSRSSFLPDLFFALFGEIQRLL